MSAVKPRVETAEEAKASIESSIKMMIRDTSGLDNYVSELLELAAVIEDDSISKILIEIQEQVNQLTNYLRDDTEGCVKGE